MKKDLIDRQIVVKLAGEKYDEFMNEVYEFAFSAKKRMYNTCLSNQSYVQDIQKRNYIQSHIDKKDQHFSRELTISTQRLEDYLTGINHDLIFDDDGLVDLTDAIDKMKEKPGKLRKLGQSN